MVIKIDKDAEKILIEIIDGYTKYVGLKGVNNVNAIMRGVKMIPESEVESPMKKIETNVPEVDKTKK